MEWNPPCLVRCFLIRSNCNLMSWNKVVRIWSSNSDLFLCKYHPSVVSEVWIQTCLVRCFLTRSSCNLMSWNKAVRIWSSDSDLFLCKYRASVVCICVWRVLFLLVSKVVRGLTWVCACISYIELKCLKWAILDKKFKANKFAMKKRLAVLGL
jgi:hypothetical protein